MRWLDAQGRVFGKVSLVDLVIVCMMISLSPAIYYLYGSVFGKWRMTIVSVSPSHVTAGIERQLTILGYGFDPKSTVQLGQHPPLEPKFVSFINESRLVVDIPIDLEPGWHHVYVRNGRGRLVVQEEAFQIIWVPEMTRVVLTKFEGGTQVILDIFGRYFEERCEVRLGLVSLESTHVDSTHLRVETSIGSGRSDLRVINPTGERQAVLAGTVELSPAGIAPLVKKNAMMKASVHMTSVADALTANPPPEEQSTPERLLVLCALSPGSSFRVSSVPRGVIQTDSQGGVLAKIVDVQESVLLTGNTAANPEGSPHVSTETVVLASVVLAGDVRGSGPARIYAYQGRPLAIGSQLELPIGSSKVVGVVVSEPMSLKEAAPENLL